MKGRFSGLWLNPADKTVNLLLTVPYEAKDLYDKLSGEDLDIEIKKYRNKRSTDANKTLWWCIDKISKALTPPLDKWEVYLNILKSYGKYTYICVKPNVVDAIKSQWRECEVIGEIDINGAKAVQILCYFGSSTYNTEEFSHLLDGTIEEMKQMGLTPPTPEEVRASLDAWEKRLTKESGFN